MKPGDEIGNIKFRREDAFWNVYYEEHDSLPVFFGGIALVLIDTNERRRQQFVGLMLDCFDDLVKKRFGFTIDFANMKVIAG